MPRLRPRANLKAGTVKKISLITSYDDKTQLSEMESKLEELKQSLLELDVELEVKLGHSPRAQPERARRCCS